ncbi:hypothetical protein DY000_02030519 [Brassica cretica]|uniref:Replication factor A C-terminal domain-containing protein n=1 Tax=Brassica cretica TaxID=69181 RepID=A0ABQ7DL48_BRACR|nr:hypothetical protein DY000_02030519 [Brassica cretica]
MWVCGKCCGLHRSVVGYIGVLCRFDETSKNPSRDKILIASTSSSSPIEEQRSRDLIEPFLHNQYLLNDFISPPPFHPPLYTDLLYFVLSKTLEPLKSQSMAMKRNGKSPVSSNSDEKVMFFKDVSLGPHETQLRFRLIHLWEARNPVKKTLIGLEMLLIDEQGTVIQGFIPPGRIKKYLPEMKRGPVYKLINFYGSKNKPVYRVDDHVATVSFTWNSKMSVLREIPISFDEGRFRFHSYEDFEANCDLKGDLYDVVGHMKLVDGQTLIERPSLDDVKIATTRHIMIHVQSHDGPVMKLYLWDQAATDFCKKFNSCENTPTVLLVTTVNTKRLGGTLALTSMSSTRVFMDYDVQPTSDYFTWYVSPSSASILYRYILLHESGICKGCLFECTATIDDVVHGSPWYYIACSECHSKATNSPSSLICTNTRCGKVNTAGFAQYRAKISVYDNSEQDFFVLLGDAGQELTGRHASELVSNYFEANKSEGADHEVPVPEALVSTIGQTHKFCVKVIDHNFSGNTRAITVTKILSLDTPPPTEASVGNDIATMSEEATQSGNDVCEPPKGRGDSADEESKRTCSSADPETAKRSRCEN